MTNEMKLRPEARAMMVKFGMEYPTIETIHKIPPTNKKRLGFIPPTFRLTWRGTMRYTGGSVYPCGSVNVLGAYGGCSMTLCGVSCWFLG